ncbi:metallo-beta-lactamase domain-containing protein 1-like [Chiloscyllium punctatum]|uniref:metallo-beta-lactamase domain-containing protein 1-like n=1 Tax=Chiloscyllium punctatum TaxID=137246 RepID=UPI003B6322DE
MSTASTIRTQPLGALTIPGDPYSVFVLKEGYAYTDGDGNTRADGTITLLKGSHVVLVDTGNPWDRDHLLRSLGAHGLEPEDVSLVVCTHGHSDHVGNLNLFPEATVVVSHDVSADEGTSTSARGWAQACRTGWMTGWRCSPRPGHCAGDVSVLILFPAIHIHATGSRGCCANRCGMFLSIVFAAVGSLGAGYCLIVSSLGLVNGPMCQTGTNNWSQPFFTDLEELELNEDSYLFHPEMWDSVCKKPKDVIVFNVVLFALLIGFSGIELVLCLLQMVNGLFGCLCGTCGKSRAGPV